VVQKRQLKNLLTTGKEATEELKVVKRQLKYCLEDGGKEALQTVLKW
jgi:hypothetical protein